MPIIEEIESDWYLLDGIHCDCDKDLPYTLTTDGHHWAQCPNNDCLKIYQCACDAPEKQSLGYINGVLVCLNCGTHVYEEAW
jgi:hypothetical protein